jgi:hypothetical protein
MGKKQILRVASSYCDRQQEIDPPAGYDMSFCYYAGDWNRSPTVTWDENDKVELLLILDSGF